MKSRRIKIGQLYKAKISNSCRGCYFMMHNQQKFPETVGLLRTGDYVIFLETPGLAKYVRVLTKHGPCTLFYLCGWLDSSRGATENWTLLS